ncbi:hypothetical protein HGG72_19415 [Ochrobactrum pecoris]|uniref:Uncharacterized protein n=1 Tax=Brucella pecoris TaxID=867683 RepID=A0A5C5CUT6_9HYPH|nr:hypothetical protein [Brucella pecoris]MBB4092316.1 hypothetical protein [Brucella pecoris]NKW81998.1 hypothetical protein [Brucella pecoris]TNV15259.1 hypothetical protein FIB18_00415 [Brucella pecoris]
MSSLLPPLHDGHAPIYLHHAFQDAVDAYEDWTPETAEPVVRVNGKTTRISVVFRRLWNCTDMVPRHTLEALRDIVPTGIVLAEHWKETPTFAEAARIMRAALEGRKARRLPVVC